MLVVVAPEPGGPEQLQVAERPVPEPGPGEVLVRVVAAGVNRADLLQRQGHYPPPRGASEVLGLECAGYVAGLGHASVSSPAEQPSSWRIGDPCLALLAGGGYAQFVSVPAGQLLTVPEGVDLVTATGLVEVAATVVSNFDAAAVRPGEVVLIHGGAGGIGSMAIQYAKALGAVVAATAGSPGKLDYCRSIGADLAVSYRDDWVGAVRDLSHGRGADVILDVIGAKYLEQHVRLLATGGRLVVIGLQGGTKATLDLGRLLGIRGSVLATTLRSRPIDQKAAICRRVEEVIWPLVAEGAIVSAPQTRFTLQQVVEAHRHLESGDNLGKVVLTIDTA
ncbi:putative quinone oxidoreductase [Microlunatus phosphovorus NM-1]|uniref:Putative quinone oxidoreductase n=1 Tax=Microlunatus phosphovorus (strain ATCC 700054 / DSM 10555 / JCM 9379 / NBRC 101784 / NCIMB 13414 / VKM Ac-1990 / NM-1) TaxID=1032480 RepID=F5XHB7_MICPN|nr:NAD(P)H-quinone oxidoreductase [Microlunatus phosphovorus]BAK38125.1 putative quinone oxidoreductase [Microlunatus phosphovorus NM-1]